MVASGQAVTDGFGGAILQKDRGVIAEHGVANGGLHADAGGTSSDDEVADSL